MPPSSTLVPILPCANRYWLHYAILKFSLYLSSSPTYYAIGDKNYIFLIISFIPIQKKHEFIYIYVYFYTDNAYICMYLYMHIHYTYIHNTYMHLYTCICIFYTHMYMYVYVYYILYIYKGSLFKCQLLEIKIVSIIIEVTVWV
jgi:hypothetical protein